MKEFQALGLDISIINDKGENLELKEIEDAEDKDDMKTSVDEVETAPIITDSKDINEEIISEEESEENSLEVESEEGADL